MLNNKEKRVPEKIEIKGEFVIDGKPEFTIKCGNCRQVIYPRKIEIINASANNPFCLQCGQPV